MLQEDTSDSGKFDWVASYRIEDIGTFSKILHKRTISNETGIVIAKVPDPETTPETVIEKKLNLVNEGFDFSIDASDLGISDVSFSKDMLVSFGTSYPGYSGVDYNLLHTDYVDIQYIPDDYEVKVGVIGTGVNVEVSGLIGTVVINDEEIPNNGIDDDGNGYIDDYLGWNEAEDSGNISDKGNHETQVASIIAGQRVPDSRHVGINPDARLIIVYDSVGGKAVDYCVDRGAEILNMSYYGTQTLLSHLNDFYDNGRLLGISSAGNDSSYLEKEELNNNQTWTNGFTIGGYDYVVDTRTREQDPHSNYGPAIDFAGPYTVRAQGRDEVFGKRYGTSFAAPVFTGIISRLRGFNPDYTRDEIYDLLETYSIPLDDNTTNLGHGQLDVLSLINEFVDIEKRYIEVTNPSVNLLLECHIIRRKTGELYKVVLKYIYSNQIRYPLHHTLFEQN